MSGFADLGRPADRDQFATQADWPQPPGTRTAHGHTERAALQQHQLHAGYQPILCLRSGAVWALEALSRWTHADGRCTDAASHLPALRALGLMAEVDWVTINDALNAIAHWRARRGHAGTPVIHLNLSQELLGSPWFVEHFLRLAEIAGLRPAELAVEVAETLDLEAQPRAHASLAALAERGVALVLDDFAAGHSALNTLIRLPFAAIKTDKSLLRSARTHARGSRLLAWLQDLATRLDTRLIVEGIESSEDLQLATDCGCELVQGWLFAGALDRRGVEQLLLRQGVVARTGARPDPMSP